VQFHVQKEVQNGAAINLFKALKEKLHSRTWQHPDCLVVAAKVCDFGLAKINHTEGSYAGGMTGTVPYMAPEILAKQPYSFSADVYAFAVLFNETLAAERPFEGFSVDHVMHDVVATGLRPRSATSSPQALQLIQQVRAVCLNDPRTLTSCRNGQSFDTTMRIIFASDTDTKPAYANSLHMSVSTPELRI
jgi:serine/threonine protein kinase